MMIQSEDTIFVGREEELTQLMAFAKDAFAGKAGVAFVTGEAGIGKTFLVEEFFRQLRKEYEDVVIASGQCTIQSASYLPFQAILEDLLESQKKVKVSGKKFKQVTEVVVDTIWNVGPDLIGVFGIPIKALQTVVDKLGLRGKESAPELEVPKELNQFKIFGWYTKIMKDISEQFPLVLFIDDLHWADDSSLNLLLYLGRETEDQRMLVIGTYRPHEVQPNSLLMQVKAKLGRYGAREFPLDVSEDRAEDVKKTQQFVHAYLLTKYGTNFSDRFEQVLVDQTEGNALFLTEVLKNLEEKGQIISGSAGILPANGDSKKEDAEAGKMPALPGTPWQLPREIATIEHLPEKVENAISERVDRLEATLREILDYASVEGDDFIAQVIAKVRQIQERNLINDLTKKLMKTYQLIWERGGKSLPNGSRIHEFSFRHNLIREYIYAQLSETDKEFIHAEIGECLERLYEPNTNEIASQLAIHFFHGHVLDKAMLYCLKAAQDANIRYGASEAVRFSKMGLEALEERKNVLSQEEFAKNKMRLLLELAKAEEIGGDPNEEKDHIQAGISYLKNNLLLLDVLPNELLAEIYAQLGKLYNRKGATRQEAKEYLEKALDIYKLSDDKKNIAEILYLLAIAYKYTPTSERELYPTDKSIKAVKESLSIAGQLKYVELQLKCLSSLAWSYHDKEVSYGGRYALQAKESAKKLAKKYEASDYHYIKMLCLDTMAKDCRDHIKFCIGIQYLKRCRDVAIQVGDIFSEAKILTSMGYDYGRYVNLQREAQNALEESLRITERLGFADDETLFYLGWVLARSGKWKEAKNCFQKAIDESNERRHAMYRYNIGRLYLLQGDYARAKTEFLYRFQILEKYQRSLDLLEYARVALEYALLEDDLCWKYINDSQTLFEQEKRPRFKWPYLYEIAEVYRILGECESAKTACCQSIEWLLSNAEDPKKLLFVTEARLVMGKILVDMGKYGKAISYLDEAKNAFEICGHYALGETLLYLGKAHQGLGGAVFLRQAKEYVNNALAEFQRLELFHKEREAREVLESL